VRAQGRATPFSWDTIAEAWESHINWMIDPKSSRHVDEKTRCKQCGAATLHLADGYHCTACGYFTTAM